MTKRSSAIDLPPEFDRYIIRPKVTVGQLYGESAVTALSIQSRNQRIQYLKDAKSHPVKIDMVISEFKRTKELPVSVASASSSRTKNPNKPSADINDLYLPLSSTRIVILHQ